VTGRDAGEPGRGRGGSGDGRGNGPRPVGDSVPRLLRRLGAPPPDTMAVVFGRWAEVAGPVLVDHTRPLRMDGTTLLVAADHPAWATRTRMETGPMLERAKGLGDTRIERVEVVVQRP
jgi:predicted nucleic acid-binding Zn ribbon protein